MIIFPGEGVEEVEEVEEKGGGREIKEYGGKGLSIFARLNDRQPIADSR